MSNQSGPQTVSTASPTLLQRALVALDILLSNLEPFTILDISEIVKKDGNPYVHHRDVRDTIKPVIDVLVVGRGYERTVVEVTLISGAKDWAAVYHPKGVSADAYTKRTQAATAPTAQANGTCSTAPKQASTQPKLAPLPTHVANAKLSAQVNVRKNGALEVPKSILDIAFGNRSVIVDVVNHPNSVSVVPGNERSSGYKNSGFRLSARTLAESNLSGKKTLTVCAFGDKVVISA